MVRKTIRQYLREKLSSVNDLDSYIDILFDTSAVDYVRCRNMCIYRDFDLMNKRQLEYKTIQSIYDELAYRYDVSQRTIKEIILTRYK